MQAKLRAEACILARTNTRLAAESNASKAAAAALQAQVAGLQAQVADAATLADILRAELHERDRAAAETNTVMEGLQRRIKHLEGHTFVLTHKVGSKAACLNIVRMICFRRALKLPPGCAEFAPAGLPAYLPACMPLHTQTTALAEKLKPKEQQVVSLQQQLAAQDRELLAGQSAVLAAQRAVADKGAAVTAAKRELLQLRHKANNQAALLDAVAHDIAGVLQAPAGQGQPLAGASSKAASLDGLACRYLIHGGPRTSQQVEAEMAAHISAAERKASLLKTALAEVRALSGRSHHAQNLPGSGWLKTPLRDPWQPCSNELSGHEV